MTIPLWLWHQYVEWLADNLCNRVPEGFLDGEVDEQDIAFLIYSNGHISCCFSDNTITLFAVSQFLLCVFTLGDITRNPEDFILAHWRDRPIEPDIAVIDWQAVFDMNRL